MLVGNNGFGSSETTRGQSDLFFFFFFFSRETIGLESLQKYAAQKIKVRSQGSGEK
jgi:hypothetical protein